MNGYRVEVVAERLAALASGLATLAAERQEHETAWQQRRLAIADSGRRPARTAAYTSEPTPANGDSTRSPRLDHNTRHRSITSSCSGCTCRSSSCSFDSS